MELDNMILGFLIILIAIIILIIVLSVKFKTFGKIFGAIFALAGAGALVYSLVRVNTFESKLVRAFGGTDEVMAACLVLGGIGLVLGIILLVISRSEDKPPVFNVQAPSAHNSVVHEVKVRCTKCQALNDELSKFCKECGNPIITEKAEA